MGDTPTRPTTPQLPYDFDGLRNYTPPPASPPLPAINFSLSALQRSLPVALTASQRNERLAQLHTELKTMDRDHDGTLSPREIRFNGRLDNDFMRMLNFRQDMIGLALSNMPNAPSRGVLFDDWPIFNREQIVRNAQNAPVLQGLTREEIDQAIRQAFPRGVATITFADQCDTYDVGCLRIGTDKVLISPRGGPSL